MASLLQPRYELTLGSQLWKEQALRLDVRLDAAPTVDSLTVWLPAEALLKAVPGNDAGLTLETGEKSAPVFRGTIGSVARSFDSIRITALNGGAALGGYRPATTFEHVTAGTVIESLSSDIGIAAGSVEDGIDLAYYAADPSRSAWEHIARLASWSGALARISAENEIEATVINGAEAEVALRYGRELIGFESAQAPSAVEQVVVAGESGAGSATAPEAMRPTTDFFAGNRPSGPDAQHLWRWQPALRTAQAAATAGASLTRNRLAQSRSGRLEAFLQPDLRVGTVVQVSDLPKGLGGGPFWLRSVRHRLDARGATTVARFVQDAEGFDPMALLGSLGTALGGVL